MGNSTEARDSPVQVITPQSIHLYTWRVYEGVDGP